MHLLRNRTCSRSVNKSTYEISVFTTANVADLLSERGDSWKFKNLKGQRNFRTLKKNINFEICDPKIVVLIIELLPTWIQEELWVDVLAPAPAISAAELPARRVELSERSKPSSSRDWLYSGNILACLTSPDFRLRASLGKQFRVMSVSNGHYFGFQGTSTLTAIAKEKLRGKINYELVTRHSNNVH